MVINKVITSQYITTIQYHGHWLALNNNWSSIIHNNNGQQLQFNNNTQSIIIILIILRNKVINTHCHQYHWVISLLVGRSILVGHCWLLVIAIGHWSLAGNTPLAINTGCHWSLILARPLLRLAIGHYHWLHIINIGIGHYWLVILLSLALSLLAIGHWLVIGHYAHWLLLFIVIIGHWLVIGLGCHINIAGHWLVGCLYTLAGWSFHYSLLLLLVGWLSLIAIVG